MPKAVTIRSIIAATGVVVCLPWALSWGQDQERDTPVRPETAESAPLYPLPGGPAFLDEIPGPDGVFPLQGIPDVAVTVSSLPPVVDTGANMTYTITVRNKSSIPASNVTVRHELPAGMVFKSATATSTICNFSAGVVTCVRSSIAAGLQMSISVEVVAPTVPGVVVANTTVTLSVPDENPGDNVAVTETTVNSASADVGVNVVALPNPVNEGFPLTFRINVSKTGFFTAYNVVVKAVLPPSILFQNVQGTNWTCLEVTGMVTCTFVNALTLGQADPLILSTRAPLSSGPVSMTTTVSTTTPDPNPINNTFVSTTTVTPALADLSVVLSDSPDPVSAGGAMTYSVAVSNGGPGSAPTLTLVTALPAGVTFQSYTALGWFCAHNSGTVTCFTAAPLPSQSQAQLVTIRALAPATGGIIVAQSTISSTVSDPSSSNNVSTAETLVEVISQDADLSILMTDAPDPVVQSTSLAYSIVVSNAGPGTAELATVVDTLPGTLQYVGFQGTGWGCTHASGVVQCVLAQIPSGAASTLTLLTTAPFPLGGITNSASVSSLNADPDLANNAAQESTLVVAPPNSADLRLSLTDEPDPITGGQTITYTLTMANDGPADAGTVTLVQNLPAAVTLLSAQGPDWTCVEFQGRVTCTLAAGLPLGMQTTVLVAVRSPVPGGVQNSSAMVTSTSIDPVPGNNSASAQTTVVRPAEIANMSLVKNDVFDPVAAGTDITYNLSVSNAGPDTARDVVMTDTLPPGVTFQSADAPAGWSCADSGGVVTCSVSSLAPGVTQTLVLVVTSPLAGATLNNLASVASSLADENLVNNSEIERTVVLPPPPPANLSLTVTDTPDPVPGSLDLTYSIVAHNASPTAATSLKVEDHLPAGSSWKQTQPGLGWTCNHSKGVVTCGRASMGEGQFPVATILIQSPETPGVAESLVTIVSGSDDLDPNDNTVVTTTTVLPPPPRANLSIQISDSPDPVTAGQPHTYTLHAGNAGPDPAESVVIRDPLPPGEFYLGATGEGWSCQELDRVVTCTRPSLPLGQAPELAIRASAAGRFGFRLNEATISSATLDQHPGNDTARAQTTILAPPRSAGLSLSIADIPDPVPAGQPVAYNHSVLNLGPDAAESIVLFLTPPAGLPVTGASGAGWTCGSASGGGLECSRATLSPGQSSVLTVTHASPANAASLTAKAGVRSRTADPVIVDNFASQTTTVGVALAADLSVSVEDLPDPVTAGREVTYLLDVQNQGPWPSDTIRIEMMAPPGASSPRAQGEGWSCVYGGVDLTCVRAGLAPDAGSGLSVTLKAPGAGGVASGSVEISSATPDPALSDNTALIETTVQEETPGAGLSLARPAGGSPMLGATFSYELVARNDGPLDAQEVVVTEQPAAGLEFVSAVPEPEGGGPDPLGLLRFDLAELPAGQSRTIRIMARCASPFVLGAGSASVTSVTHDPETSDNVATAPASCTSVSVSARFTPAEMGARFTGQTVAVDLPLAWLIQPGSVLLSRVDDVPIVPIPATQAPGNPARFLLDAQEVRSALMEALGSCTTARGATLTLQVEGLLTGGGAFAATGSMVLVQPPLCAGADPCLRLSIRRISFPVDPRRPMPIQIGLCSSTIEPESVRLTQVNGMPVVPVPALPPLRPGLPFLLPSAETADAILEALGGCPAGARPVAIMGVEGVGHDGEPFLATGEVQLLCGRGVPAPQ